MNIGSAWAKTEEKDGKKVLTGISIGLDDTVKELFPQLAKVKFVLKPIPADQRKKENSPNYRLVTYKPQEQTQSESSSDIATDEEIPF
jgi:uncharacterized protein (DUF736 family)